MKKIILNIFLLFTISATFVSCDSYLNPGYDEYMDKAEVFTSYTYSNSYVRTMYSYLPSDAYYETLMTDEAKHSDPASSYLIMNDGSYDSRNYVEAWKWNHFYAGIRRVHVFFENVDKAVFIEPNAYKASLVYDSISKTNYSPLNDSLRRQYRAEGRFLRAFYYFELLKRFGNPEQALGVPIVPERLLTVNDTLDFPRKTYQQCVDYIVTDCNEAAKVLPERLAATYYGQATKAAAMALKSRLLLYAASPLANPTNDPAKWKLAIAAASDLLSLTSYKLMLSTNEKYNNMLGIFTLPNNDEVYFSSPVIQSNSFEAANFPPGYSGKGLINPSQDLVDAFETIFGFPISDIPNSKYDPTKPYYRRDRRLDYFIFTSGSIIAATEPYTIETFVDGADGLNRGVGYTKTGYYIRKFIDPKADVKNGKEPVTHFWVHFRYAEALLNYAEAVNAVYGPVTPPPGQTLTALQAYKNLRLRVGGMVTPASLATATPEAFYERIKNERRVELCFEGHRFWDVRRWKEGEKYFNKPLHGMKITKISTTNPVSYTYEVFDVENRVFDAKMYAMPIPYSEMQKSKLLIQNTGW